MTTRPNLTKGGIIAALVIVCAGAATSQPAVAPKQAAAQPALDFEFFKARVEPIFLKKREGHAR